MGGPWVWSGEVDIDGALLFELEREPDPIDEELFEMLIMYDHLMADERVI